ncbi:hypothetical protein ACTFIT_002493 [Dictyostelium discoideum]
MISDNKPIPQPISNILNLIFSFKIGVYNCQYIYENCHFNNVNFKSQLNEPSRNETIQFKKASYYLPHYKFDDGIYFTQSQSVFNYKKNGFSTNQLGIRNEQSPFISYTSYIDIAEEPFRFLKGHAAKGKALFPGCGYIDNVLRAFPNQDLTIHSMEFKSPLQLIEGIKQCLTTNIYSSGKNEYRVVFNYKDNKTGKWILSAHGKFTILNIFTN